MVLSLANRRPSSARIAVALCAALAAVPGLWPEKAMAQAPPAAAVTTAPSAQAAVPAVNAEGAAALSKTLADIIGKYLAQPAKAGAGVTVGGIPIVMPSGDSYLVALPPLSLRGEDQERLDIASIGLAVKPMADQTFGVTITLPTSAVYLENGDAVTVLTFGDHKITGVWSPAGGGFIAMDVAMSDVQMTSVYEDYWFGIGSLSFTQDLRPDTVGWSGPLALALSDVRLDKGDDTLMSAANITAETTYTRLRLNRFGDLAALGESAAGPAAQQNPAEAAKAVDGAITALRDLLGGASSRLRMSDVTFYDPDSKETVGFDQASLSGAVNDLDRDVASATLGVEVKGLSFDPAPTTEAALPSAGELKLSLHNIPIAKLLGALKTAVTPPAPGAATTDPATEVTNILTAAKVTLKLESLGVTASAGQASADGEMVANKDASFGAVGKAKLSLSGVDKMLNDLKPKKPGAKVDAENADIVGALTMLKAMGRPDKDKEGKPVLSYTFELKADGNVLVNDTDLAPLLSGDAPAGKSQGKKR